MHNPIPRPINPATPKAKEVKKFPLPTLYPQPMEDDVYIRPDNDSVYIPVKLDQINKTLDKTPNEDSENSN
jgi:hypothetical protein